MERRKINSLNLNRPPVCLAVERDAKEDASFPFSPAARGGRLRPPREHKLGVSGADGGLLAAILV